jgi:hypothetical protein
MSGMGTMIADFPSSMPPLTVADVTRIAAQAAREESPSLEVVGVMLGGEGSYTEVIIDITGCHVEPCRFSVGVFRDAPAGVLHDEIAGKLKRHLRDHAPQP